MNKRWIFVAIYLGLLLQTELGAQKVLTIDNVLDELQTQNYDLEIARQSLKSAKALNSKYNRGYMPTFGINGGLNYGLTSLKNDYNFGLPDIEVNNASSYSANGRASANYLLFDNGQRKARNERNRVNEDFANIQINDITRQLIFNTSQVYFGIVQSIYNLNLLEESLSISKERLRRASTYYEYGNQGKVDVLNAEVDVSRDSLNLISAKTEIQNQKWQLNQLILRNDTDYNLDTSITLTYLLASETTLKEEMFKNNTQLQTLQKNINLVELDQNIAAKTNAPTINAIGNYDLNYQTNSEASNLNYSRSNGLQLGLNFNWNILDGGQRKVQEQLAQINTHTSYLDLKKKENELTTQFNRLWNNYRNAILTMRLEGKNIKTNEQNFQRVKELFQNGQQSSLEFRQAQLNLINAKFQYFNAKISAKQLEVELNYLLNKDT